MKEKSMRGNKVYLWFMGGGGVRGERLAKILVANSWLSSFNVHKLLSILSKCRS